MKVLFGIALRSSTRFVECLLQLLELDWTVAATSTLSHRQKTLAVTPLPWLEEPVALDYRQHRYQV